MSRLAASAARIEARAVARKAATKRPSRAVERARKAKYRAKVRGPKRLLKYLPTLATDVRDAYQGASPSLRRLILEQAQDARTPFVRTGPSLDDVLAWKSA